MTLVSPFEARLGAFGRGLLDALLPPRCPGCGEVLAPSLGEETRQGLCGPCWARLRFIAQPLCDSCGLPFDYPVPGRALCLACEADPPPYDRARSVFVYDEASRDLILGFKHADRTDLAPLLARLAELAGRDLLAEADGLVPVPLHRRRLARRRFNQAALLVGALSRRTGIEDLTGLVVRQRETPPQSGGAAKRTRNVAGAFRLASSPAWVRRPGREVVDPRTRIVGRSLVIVDDVLTTGATVSAVAKLLVRGGAARVAVLTLARVDRG